MGVFDQDRFKAAARQARARGTKADWETAANVLSGLAMGDILPALVTLDDGERESVRWAASRALVTAASRRIEFAINAVSEKVMTNPGSELPKDQIDVVRQFLLTTLRPKKSQATSATFASMNAAAIPALDEVSPLTRALQIEFSGSIYTVGGRFRFTPPKAGGPVSSDAVVPVPHGTARVASYHTHPAANPNSENFSPDDLIIPRGVASGGVVLPPVVSYLGTPSGRIKKLTPPQLLHGVEAQSLILGKQELLRAGPGRVTQ